MDLLLGHHTKMMGGHEGRYKITVNTGGVGACTEMSTCMEMALGQSNMLHVQITCSKTDGLLETDLPNCCIRLFSLHWHQGFAENFHLNQHEGW